MLDIIQLFHDNNKLPFDGDDVCFVLDQHAVSDLAYSYLTETTVLNEDMWLELSTFIQTPIQPVIALTP